MFYAVKIRRDVWGGGCFNIKMLLNLYLNSHYDPIMMINDQLSTAVKNDFKEENIFYCAEFQLPVF